MLSPALLSFVAGLGLLAGVAHAEEITVATVNNGDMIIMQRLSKAWEQKTGNKINWVVLEENVLRERVTTDIAMGRGQFDIMTINGYEAPIWGNSGWLSAVDDRGGDYDGEHLDIVDAKFAQWDGLKPGEKKAQVAKSVPIGRFATPDDIKGLAIFLASAAATTSLPKRITSMAGAG